MRKRITYRQLGRNGAHRWAMLRNMVTSLIKHERITTTTARAKELRRVAEKLVTHAKGGTIQHNGRNGGYTRVLKLGKPRRGDSSDMAIIEFIDREGELRRARAVPPGGIFYNTMLQYNESLTANKE